MKLSIQMTIKGGHVLTAECDERPAERAVAELTKVIEGFSDKVEPGETTKK